MKLLQLQRLDHSGIHVIHALWQELSQLSVEELDYVQSRLSSDVTSQRQPHARNNSLPCGDVENWDWSPELAAAIEFLLSARKSGSPNLASFHETHQNAQDLIEQAALSIQDYLMAATVKDCSIFVAFQGCRNLLKSTIHSDEDTAEVESVSICSTGSNGLPNHTAGDSTFMGSSDSSFVYKIRVADLDYKDVSKIPIHFQISEKLDELNGDMHELET